MKEPRDLFIERLMELSGVSEQYADAAWWTIPSCKREDRPVQCAKDYVERKGLNYV